LHTRVDGYTFHVTSFSDRAAAELALAGGILSPPQQARLLQYVELLQDYSRILDLTALRGGGELARELAVEPLKLLELGPLPAGNAVDLGSGNGSPVVALAVACPGTSFTAVECHRRRAAFLNTVRALLGLENLAVEVRRTAELMREGARFSLVISRAYAPPEEFLAEAAQLVLPGGEVRGFTGAMLDPVLAAAQQAGFSFKQSHAYNGGQGLRHAYRLAAAADGGGPV
jgi:16S rRNA (guanine527-N7)-methyltransferase